MANKRIYIDTEYMYDAMFIEERMPRDTDKKQIIQIAAILFDTETGQEIDHLDILVKPIYHTILPDFFIKLTSITDDIIQKNGVDFITAYEKFLEFSKGHPIWTYNNDFHVIEQNCLFHNINNPITEPFIKVKPQLKKWSIDADKYSSGTLYQAAELKMQGHAHYALHDVRSMAHAMFYFENL